MREERCHECLANWLSAETNVETRLIGGVAFFLCVTLPSLSLILTASRVLCPSPGSPSSFISSPSLILIQKLCYWWNTERP